MQKLVEVVEGIVPGEERHSQGHGHIQAYVRDSVIVEVLEHYPGQLVFGMHVQSH